MFLDLFPLKLLGLIDFYFLKKLNLCSGVFFYCKLRFSLIIYSAIIKGYKVPTKHYIMIRVRYVTTLH